MIAVGNSVQKAKSAGLSSYRKEKKKTEPITLSSGCGPSNFRDLQSQA